MVRGIEGRDIFFDDSDREDFLSRVRELSLDTGTRILAWTLMNNHLLIFSGKTGLAAFMRKL
jgi:REP element-mobilizing transposase RayT